MAVFDKNTARIKMVALTQNGYDNITWYSLAKYDKPGSTVTNERIIARMLAKIKEREEIRIVNVIRFYDNKTKQQIDEYIT